MLILNQIMPIDTHYSLTNTLETHTHTHTVVILGVYRQLLALTRARATHRVAPDQRQGG